MANAFDKYLNKDKNNSSKDNTKDESSSKRTNAFDKYLSGNKEADNSASSAKPEDAYQPTKQVTFTAEDPKGKTVTTNTKKAMVDKLLYDTDEIAKQQQKAQKEYDNAVKEMNQAWQSLMGHTYTTNEIADNATMFQQKALGERKNNYETGLNRYNNLQAEVERNAQERKNLDPDFEYVASQMEKSLNQQLADGKISQDYYDEMMRGVQYTRETQAANNLYDDREEKLKLLDAKYDYLKYSPDFVKYSSGENIADKFATEAKEREDIAEAFGSAANKAAFAMGNGTLKSKYDKNITDSMYQNEIATYNYLYNKEGAEAADEYYDYIRETKLNPRYRDKVTEQFEKYGYDHPILASLSSIVLQPLNIVSGLGQAAQLITEGKMDANAPYNAMVWKNAGERQGAGQRVYDAAGGGERGNWAQWGYGTAMSVLDNVYRMLLTGGYGSKVPQEVVEALDLALMASSFAPQAIVEAKDNGMDDLQAVFVGLLESGVEILTEKVSVESFLKGNWDKKKWMSFLKQIIAEGSEEGAADILDLGIEMILAGDKTELQRTYDDYIAGGMSHYEAEKNAWREWTSQLWMDILGGAVSGGVMGGSGILKASFKNKFVTAKAVTDEFNKEIGSKVKDAEGVAKAKFTAIRNVGMIDTILKENKNELSDLERGHLEAVKKGYQNVIDTTLSGSTNEVIAKAESLSGNRTQENVLNSQLTDLVQKGTSEAQEKMLPKAGETISLDTAETANESWNTETSNLMARHGIESEVLTLDDYDNPTLTAAQQEIKGKVSKEALETARAWRDLGWGKIGFYNDEGWVDEDGKRYVTDSFTDSNGTFVINVNALKSVPAALGHELIHNLKGTSVYKDIVAHVSARLQAEGKDINVLAKEVEKTWGDTETVKGTRDAVEEIVCDFFGNRILNNIDSLVDFGKVSKPAWIKMRNGAARMISKLTSTSYKSVVQAANEIKNNLAQADNNINSYYSESLKAKQKAKAEKKGIKTVTVEETKSKAKETKVSAEDSKAAIKKQAQKIAKDLIELGDEYGLGTDDYNDAVDELLEGVDEDVKDMALNLQGAMVEGSTEVEAVKDGDIDISRVATDVIDEDGKVVAQATGENEVRLSVSTYEADGREVLSKFLETQVKKGDLTQEESEQISSTLESIYEVCKAYVDKYDSFGAWSQAAVVKDSNGKAILSVVKVNGDYKMNLDFSLVCAKRRTLDIVLNEMCKNGMIAALSEDKDIGAAQLAKINDIIKNKDGKYGDYDGFDIACDLCFVDTKRYRQYSVAGQFTKIWNGFVKKVAGANKGKLNHFNFSEYDGNIEYADGADTMNNGLNWAYLDEYMRTHTTSKDGKDITGKVEYKVAKYLSEHHDQLKLLRNGDFMSTVGFTNVLRDAPEILKLYNSKKGSGGPKASFDNVQYLNEISQQSGFSADKAYVVGGVRVQSFSDYMPRMVFDYMQMMAEMAGKNLPAHSYTKVPLYVKQFGLTGMKINMSLTPKVIKGGVAAGLDENGNYAWADESFPYEEALLIQADKAYGKNCGTIAVGVSDAMIRKMMSDPNIRMIIPYHKSGINPIVAHMKFIDGFSEYTNSQNTRYWAVDKNGKGSWKKLDKSMEDFNFNERLHELTKQGRTGTDVVDQVVDEYLDFCHEHHYLPKFSEFLTAKGDNAYERTDGYYKMIEDFTLIDGDGIYQPQGAVQMMFPGEDSAFGSLQSLIEEGLEADNILEQRRAPGSESIESILGVIKNEMLGDNWQAKGYTSKKKSNSKAKLSVSAEDSSDYLELAKDPEKNKAALEKYVEKYARELGFNSPKVYHGTVHGMVDENGNRVANNLPVGQSKYPFTTFKGGARGLSYFSTNKNVADGFTYRFTEEDGALYSAYLKMDNPYVVDLSDNDSIPAYYNIPVPTEMRASGTTENTVTTEEIAEWARDNGYDGVIIKGLYELVEGLPEFLGDDYIVFDSSQIKSADPVTYDDQGNVIPLEERFNDKNNDIRFSVSQDSNGNELSPEQIEFFKDSKVRDENGQLKVMYHGTSNYGFTIFDKDEFGNFGLFGMGNYFTDNKDIAENYTHKGRGSNRGIYSVYLNILNPIDMDADADLNKWREAFEEYDADTSYLNGCVTNTDCFKALKEYCEDEMMYQYDAWEYITDIIQGMGYDGITHTGGVRVGDTQHRVYITFDSNQTKNIDNTSPTSDDDIRYSVSQGNGYDGYSMSNNARAAYESGEKPISKWTKADVISEIANDLGIPDTEIQLTKPYKEYLKRSSWHHTSAKYNKTDFYSVAYNDSDITISDKGQAIIDNRKNQFRDDMLSSLQAEIDELNNWQPETKEDGNYIYVTNPLATNGYDKYSKQYIDTEKAVANTQSKIQSRIKSDKERMNPRFSVSKDNRELSIDFGSGDLTVSKSSSADVLDSEPVDPRAMSIDEAMKTYELYRNERKVYDRARSINRLTEDEMIIVGRLLRGESVLESFANNPRYNNIKAVYEASQQYNELGKKLEKYRKGIKANYFKEADSYLDGNMDKFKDKKLTILYDTEVADRNIRDVVQDKALAKAILDTYFTPVQQANAQKIKDLIKYRNKVRELNLSRDVAKGNTISESAAVQMVGELEDKLVSIDAKRNRGTKKNRAIAQEEYFKVEKQLNDLWESNPKLDKDKIERACVEFRKIYDELIDRMNRTRVANGYEPVPYRQGYFPHFLDEEPDTLLGKMAYKLGIRLNQDALPTTINGATENRRPGIRWFGNTLERKGEKTTFDAVQGFDKYVEGALDMIHHTENIQRIRALATRIRYNASDEGIKRQIEVLLNDTVRTDEEIYEAIKQIYKEAPTKLSNFVVWLDEYGNLLANKKSAYDRIFERAGGRSLVYSFMRWANSRVASNMIGGNLSSAFTNFIPLAQANSVIGPRWVIQAAYQTLRNTNDKDGFIDTSNFLVNRYGSEKLVDDTGKFAQALGVPMELIDGFASQTVVRAAYLKNKASGMSDEMAMADADRLAYLMMANRSKGEMPNIMSAQNPFIKAFTAFQLEVNNEYRFLLKDLPERKREEGKSVIVALMMYFLNSYLFNDIYETIVGRRSALDPLDWVNQFVGDATGYRMPNFLNEVLTDGLSADDFRTERKGFTDTATDMLNTIGEDLPFSSAIGLVDSNFSGGRIPLSSAVPNFTDISKAIEGGNAAKIGYELYDELSKPLSYLVLPTGGNQAQKTGKAALEYMMGEGFNYDSYGNKIIRYPVEQNVPNAIKGAMFGRSAFPTFQDWLDNGSLSTAQSEIYNELDGAVSDSNVDIYNALKNLNTRANTDTKLSSIYDSGLSSEAQEMIYRDIMSDSQVNALDDALAGGMDFSEYLDSKVIKGPYADQINDAVSSLGTKASADAKAQAVINLDIPYEDKMDALRSIMTDSSYTKMMAGATYGVEPGDYIGAKLLKGQYDIDGNGNYNQAETTALINAEYGKKSNKVKAVLWQMLSGATSAKNNPYDIAAGQRYLDSMN